jgi:hypothetical protein
MALKSRSSVLKQIQDNETRATKRTSWRVGREGCREEKAKVVMLPCMLTNDDAQRVHQLARLSAFFHLAKL